MALPTGLQLCKDAGFLVRAKERSEFLSHLVIRFTGTPTPWPMGLEKSLIRLQYDYTDIDAVLPEGVIEQKPAGERPIVRFDPHGRNVTVQALTASQYGIPIKPKGGLSVSDNYEQMLPRAAVEYFVARLRKEWGSSIPVDPRLSARYTLFAHTSELRNSIRAAELSAAVNDTRMGSVGVARALELADNYVKDRLIGKEAPTDGLIIRVRQLATALHAETKDYIEYFDTSAPLEVLLKPDQNANACCSVYGTPERFFLVGRQTPFSGERPTKSDGSWTREACEAIIDRLRGCWEAAVTPVAGP